MKARDESARATRPHASDPTGSERVANARSRADDRLRRQRGALRPLGVAVIVVVVAGSAAVIRRPGCMGMRAG